MAWADMTSSPAGEICTMEDRLADILLRYPAGSVVHEATVRNEMVVADWVRCVDATLSSDGGRDA
jgi:hypothetical protein